ncbi:hypothetical protein Kpol_1036p55 [Vanderwaltozyma polyspora DSM 70294]|uniref:Arrestin-like N-terminal domain-containing protein n=1 Tax=Vanderwaltozyma polyspora (strain ATCC 22028 / DSM 70294 / BCRC 21397 / CBS 2163 / NBRC 10782 / NRRL Y-8283 / UCD 57-17) TaxID=436907 RepID=A7TEK3_VANPO|nr:uncharacterized protein Kpol_1036p55 [Vanderwaltozyma polyspora DSM 70294]EDO19310.1 hypothetical protein Kpol_1036p55 [Vanderwaltozyma polyspora DSM 70294]
MVFEVSSVSFSESNDNLTTENLKSKNLQLTLINPIHRSKNKNKSKDKVKDKDANLHDVQAKIEFFKSKHVPQNKLPIKIIKLNNLKHGGTTIKNDTGNFEYRYNPLELKSNPCINKTNNDHEGYSIELILDHGSSKVFIADLPVRNSVNASIYDTFSTSSLFDSPEAIFNVDNSLNSNSNSSPNSSTNSNSSPNSVHSNYLKYFYDEVAPVSLTGRIKINVFNEKLKHPLFLKSLSVHFKCYSNEYVCYVDPDKKNNSHNKNNIKLFENDSNTKFEPIIHLEILNISSSFLKFTNGIYEFPFEFKIEPNKFPASNCSYFGSTLYRIESYIKILKNFKKSNNSDTIILTDAVTVKRALPIDSFYLRNEPLKLAGEWQRIHCDSKNNNINNDLLYQNFNDQLNYEIYLHSKMLVIASPNNLKESEFQLNFQIVKKMKNFCISKLVVSLAQFSSIPCIDRSTKKPMKTSYVKKMEVILHSEDIEPNFDEYNVFEINNLAIFDENSMKESSNNKKVGFYFVKPFYCEKSTKLENKARLKITHKIIIQLTMLHVESTEPLKTSFKKKTILTFKVPVVLVDYEMSSSLNLPTYNKINNIYSKRETVLTDRCINTLPDYQGDRVKY